MRDTSVGSVVNATQRGAQLSSIYQSVIFLLTDERTHAYIQPPWMQLFYDVRDAWDELNLTISGVVEIALYSETKKKLMYMATCRNESCIEVVKADGTVLSRRFVASHPITSSYILYCSSRRASSDCLRRATQKHE